MMENTPENPEPEEQEETLAASPDESAETAIENEAEQPAVAGETEEPVSPEEAPVQATDSTSATPGSENFKWYILQTYSGFEQRVEKTLNEKLKIQKLEHLVQEIFVPGEDVEKVKNGKKRKVHVIYFPGYVLINMHLTDELWHVLMDIPRVSGFVGGTNREPRSLDESELGAIRSQMSQGMKQAVLKDQFEVGQQVMVIDGPFANFGGKIDEVNTEKSKLRVLISILGRSTPVELGFDMVKAQEDGE